MTISEACDVCCERPATHTEYLGWHPDRGPASSAVCDECCDMCVCGTCCCENWVEHEWPGGILLPRLRAAIAKAEGK